MRPYLPYYVDPMELDDIPEVTAIERQSFTTPWPVYAYRREIKDNRNSRYIVVRWLDRENGTRPQISVPVPQEPADGGENGSSTLSTERTWLDAIGRMLGFRRAGASARDVRRRAGVVVGYAGLWLIHDEAHITTIAVRPDLRGRGLGELMLVRQIEMAQEMGADRVTLEVRVSNEAAQNLYRKYTFNVEGVRRRYYSDDNEDALIMTTMPLSSDDFRTKFAALRSTLYARLGNKLARSG